MSTRGILGEREREREIGRGGKVTHMIHHNKHILTKELNFGGGLCVPPPSLFVLTSGIIAFVCSAYMYHHQDFNLNYIDHNIPPYSKEVECL